MSVVAGAVVPHAPLLLPEVTAVRHAPEVVSAASRIVPDGDVVVVVSPHGPRSGVYEWGRGSLAGSGLPDVRFEAQAAPAAAADLADRWGHDLIDGEVDHGIGVTLRLAPPRAPVVAVCFGDTTGPDGGPVGAVLADARALAAAVAELPGRVFVVAGAHTAASLDARAPLTERPEGRALDDAVLAALCSDVGRLADVAAGLWAAAGSCGAGPLCVLGALFAGSPATVHAYEHPVGIGYLVASVGAAR